VRRRTGGISGPGVDRLTKSTPEAVAASRVTIARLALMWSSGPVLARTEQHRAAPPADPLHTAPTTATISAAVPRQVSGPLHRGHLWRSRLAGRRLDTRGEGQYER
jgi:hypothetical protein